MLRGHHGSARDEAARDAPLRLLRGAHVLAPAELGAQDILIGGGRILAVGADLSAAAALDGLITVEALPPGRLIPGLIDQHVHFIGGGEGDGADARMPELGFEAFATAGITT